MSTPPDHCFWHYLHLFTSAPYPCLIAPPPYTTQPSHPAPLAYQQTYPPTQKTLLLILTSPGTIAILCFFGWWGFAHMHLWSDLGITLVLIHDSGIYRCFSSLETGPSNTRNATWALTSIGSTNVGREERGVLLCGLMLECRHKQRGQMVWAGAIGRFWQQALSHLHCCWVICIIVGWSELLLG